MVFSLVLKQFSLPVYIPDPLPTKSQKETPKKKEKKNMVLILENGVTPKRRVSLIVDATAANKRGPT
jgi:hypothetical protein